MTSRRAIRKSLTTNFNPDLAYRKQRTILRAQQISHLPQLIAGGKLDRPIFIVGAPRSGTTILYNVLRSSPHLAHWRPSEAHEVWEADYHPSLRGWDSNVLDASDLRPDAAARIRRTFFLVAGTRKRLIDKTPRNVVRIPFVDAIFPDARYIFLRRDGRENVNSLINAWRSKRYRTYRLPEQHAIAGADPTWWKFILYPGWRGDTKGPLEVVCAKQWVVANERALAARAAIGDERWVDVRYEDLIERPGDEVRRLLEFVDVPYDDVVRRNAEAIKTTPVNVVTPPERGKWRRENPQEIGRVEQLIAPVMIALGYDGNAPDEAPE